MAEASQSSGGLFDGFDLGSALTGVVGGLAESVGNGLFSYFGSRNSARRSLSMQKEYDTWRVTDLMPMYAAQQYSLNRDYLDRNLNMQARTIQNTTQATVDSNLAAIKSNGINPLYAVAGLGSTPSTPDLPQLAMPGNAAVGGMSAPSARLSAATTMMDIMSGMQQLRMNSAKLRSARAEADIDEADAAVARVKSAADILKLRAGIAALEGGSRLGPDAGPESGAVELITHDGWRQMRDNIAEGLRREGYMQSEARQKALDTMTVLKGVMDVISDASSSAGQVNKIVRPKNHRGR